MVLPLSPKRRAIIILVIYALLFPLGGYLAVRFMGNTKVVYDPPSGSIVYAAEMWVAKLFTTQVQQKPLMMLVTSSPPGRSLLLGDAAALFRNYSLALAAHCHGLWAAQTRTVEAYWTIPNVPALRDRLVGGTNNDSSLVVVDVSPEGNLIDVANEIGDWSQQWLASVASGANASATTLTVSFTSEAHIYLDLQNGMLSDLLRIDSITVPFAGLALCVCLRSARMVLLVAVSMPVAICLSLAAMFPLSCVMSMSSFAPEMAASVIVALSIDYSLFIGSRFREQAALHAVLHASSVESDENDEARAYRREAAQWQAVKATTTLCATNILVSGLTIAAALGGLATVDVSFMQSIGLAYCIAAVCSVFVSLTLLPSLLLVFYSFFDQPDEFAAVRLFYLQRVRPAVSLITSRLCCCCSRARGGRRQQLGTGTNGAVSVGASPLLLGADVSGTTACPPPLPVATSYGTDGVDEARCVTLDGHQAMERARQYASRWFRIGRWCFRNPLKVILVVLMAGVPFFYFAVHLKVDFNVFAQVPRDSPHAATLATITRLLGSGGSTPFYVTIVTNATGGLMSNEVFALVNQLTDSFFARAGQARSSTLSFALPDGIPITASIAEALYQDPELPYADLFNRTVSSNRRAGLVLLYPPVDPWGASAARYLDAVATAIADFDTRGLFQIGLCGSSSTSWAIMREVIALFPTQVGVTFGVIFVFIGAVFRSVFIPFRMIFTVLYTIGGAFGVGVLFLQYDWSHVFWHALTGVRAYAFLVPVFCFSLLCALALDYDTLLLTRIVEFKRLGFDDEAAVSKAVWKTGRVISFAGIIMAISFGSMCFSIVPMLNMFGITAVAAVMLDTFVVRTFFVPALLSVAPRVTWWPRRFANDLDVDNMKES